MPTILLTGATGYIGRRLERALRTRQDLRLRLLVRNARKLTPKTRLHCEVIEGDSFDPAVLERALHGVDAAYYLIHSMGTGRDFSQLDRTSAEINVEGDPGLAAGAVIELAGLGKLSGNYTITRATHRITRSDGYTTSLELKRVAPPATAKVAKGTAAKPKGLKVYGVQEGQVKVVGTTQKEKK